MVAFSGLKASRHLLLLAALLLVAVGCEKMVLDDDDAGSSKETAADYNVVLRASAYNIIPFSQMRAVESLTNYCSKLCFVVYQDGVQKKKVLPKRGDEGYGETSMKLVPGTYQLLIVGHSSNNNPTLSNPASVKFANADGFTDTFYYYGDLEVTDEADRHDLLLERATSMLRIILTDERMPQTVDRIRVYYTGESGVFDATIGWGGTVNSKQYTMFDVAGRTTPPTLEVYTFLRDDIGSLNVALTAYDVEANIIAEKELNDVPMKNRMVTEYTGSLFDDNSTTAEQTISLLAETEWRVYKRLNF